MEKGKRFIEGSLLILEVDGSESGSLGEGGQWKSLAGRERGVRVRVAGRGEMGG